MSRHWVSAAVLLAVTVGIYAPVTGSFFEGYDDFLVLDRAAFEDAQHPSRMFTTSHFDSPKYRPLARVLDYVTYHWGGGRPLWFRMRSLAGHVWAVAMVYGVAVLLFGSWTVALPAAALFAVHPLVNQPVVVCTWTITMADALVLTSLFFFIYAVQAQRPWAWLSLSLLAAWVTLFMYESGIVIFGLMYGYLAAVRLRCGRAAVSRRFLLSLTLGVAMICATVFASRYAVLTRHAEGSAVGRAIKNLVFYDGAILSAPFDSILAHDLFDAPLPSEMRLDSSAALPIAVGLGVGSWMAALLWRRLGKGPSGGVSWPTRMPWMEIMFLAVSANAFLLPFLAFNEHASETYLYLPVALSCMFITAVLYHSIQRPPVYVACLAVFAVLFASATWNRNLHVERGAAVAKRILENLPITNWSQGSREVRLAAAEPPVSRYGIYEYEGLGTIDPGGPAVFGAVSALRWASGNQDLTAIVVPPTEMLTECPEPAACFLVHRDGSVAAVERVK
jgi:hypothetical protein